MRYGLMFTDSDPFPQDVELGIQLSDDDGAIVVPPAADCPDCPDCPPCPDITLDYIDWLVLGAHGTVLTIGTAPHPGTTNLGMPFTVTDSDGVMERRDEGTDWTANFTIGDHLIWTRIPDQSVFPGALVIQFSTPIIGARAQIAADFYGTFTGFMTAFDASNNILASSSRAGTSSAAQDGSAIALTVWQPTRIIDHISFDVRNAAGGTLPAQDQDFVINRVDLIR